MMRGILAYGTYLPYHRLQRSAIGSTLGTSGGKGTRTVASYDEDSTSMGVEAARVAMAASPTACNDVLFATSTPAYLDKTNATAIHAALGLGHTGFAGDVGGAVRSGLGALTSAMFRPAPTLVVLSDVRTGLPGSADEREGGDAATAFVVGEAKDDEVVAEYLGGASVSAEFLDRWRVPGEPASKGWEERFGEHAYLPLVEPAVTDALKSTGLAGDQVDHVVVTGTHSRAVRAAAGSCGLGREGAVADDLVQVVGNTGTAHPGLVLASVLDTAQPGDIVGVVLLADGVDVALFRVGAGMAGYRRATTVAAQAAAGRELPYPTFLTWRGFLHREPPRRPDPDRPSAPAAFRSESWKFSFTGSRCDACGMRHLPPQRVCVRCGAVDQVSSERLADVKATVATYAVDHLQYSLNPPVVSAVIDFDGGGRLQCELTDVDAGNVHVGDRLEMTFRLLHASGGVRNYFWKARPIREGN